MDFMKQKLIFKRQMGGKTPGRLIKSASMRPQSCQLKSISIPSKYVTTFVENGRTKGFGSSTMRFNYLLEPGNELPGPGEYELYK